MSKNASKRYGLEDYIPPVVRAWLKERFHASLVKDPVVAVKYFPARSSQNSYAVGFEEAGLEKEDGLPLPPEELWLGYGDSKQAYLDGGESHVAKMLEILGATGYAIKPGQRILDFGCAAGRMTRHLALGGRSRNLGNGYPWRFHSLVQDPSCTAVPFLAKHDHSPFALRGSILRLDLRRIGIHAHRGHRGGVAPKFRRTLVAGRQGFRHHTQQ